jgi:hypothetical protein
VPRILPAIVVATAVLIGWTTPEHRAAAQVPRDPCTLLTRAQARRLLLGKRIMRVTHRDNAQNQAVECTWISDFFQTPRLRASHAPLSLQITLQPRATASAALDELRALARTPTNEVTSSIPDLGGEAYLHLGDVVVVSGPVVVQVALNNYNSAAKPYPSVDAITTRAAVLVLHGLAAPVSDRVDEKRPLTAEAA